MLDLVKAETPAPPVAKPAAKLARWSADKPTAQDERIWQAVVDASRSDAAPAGVDAANADVVVGEQR